jgi:hypothetical protein
MGQRRGRRGADGDRSDEEAQGMSLMTAAGGSILAGE